MATIKRFEDLDVWQKSRSFNSELYIQINESKAVWSYDLKDQILRSSGSCMDNIAEGFEREGTKEFIQFLSYAKGSIGESRSQLYRALDREYIDKEKFETLLFIAEELSKSLSGFMTYLKSSNYKGNKFNR
jgi:four helix bundle protein